MEKNSKVEEIGKCLNKKLKRKEFNNIKNEENYPKKIIFEKDLISDCNYSWDSNSLLIFTSINNIPYIIYSDKEQSIIAYNLINNQKQTEIKKAHKEEIDILKHCFDKKEKRDLIISYSKFAHYIKLWNFKNWELLFSYEGKKISHELLLYNNFDNKFFILTCSSFSNEDINVYNIKDIENKKLNSSKGNIKRIDEYYDNDSSKNFVIVIYDGYIASFDFNLNVIYQTYNNLRDNYIWSLIVYKSENKTKLIISSSKGNIKIWDFHSGILENYIFVNKRILRAVCPFNENYFFTGSNTIKLVNINNKKIEKLSERIGSIASIQKYIHPHFGECLITKSDSKIKLWRMEN